MTEFVEEFLEFKKIDHRCSPLTLDAYRRDLYALGQVFPEHVVETLTKADLRHYVADMQEKGAADATIRRRWSALTQYFSYLIDEAKVAELTSVPTRGFKFPISSREEAFHLVPEQRRQLFEFLELRAERDAMGTLDLALYGLLYYAGLRVTEGVSRTFADLYEEDGHRRLHVLGKRNKEREVVLHPMAVEWLDAWLSVRPDVAQEPNYLFVHPSRRQVVSRKLAWRRLKQKMREAGLDEDTVQRTSPHTLRHTRASDIRREGYDMLVIQRFLGHASVRTTEIYTHVQDAEVDNAVLGVD